MSQETIFDKIINKEIPAEIVHEDELCLAFKDISPQAPTHVLLIPKERIATLCDLKDEHKELMGHLMIKSTEIAQKLGLHENGYRLVANCKDDGCQSVNHIHFHILGGRAMTWPPG